MDIITLQEYKQYSDATFESTNTKLTALYTGFCESAEGIVKKYLKYNPISTSYEETFSSNIDTNCIKANAKNITSIDSVLVNGVSLSPLLFFAVDEYIFSSIGEKVFTTGFNNISISYTAGYAFEEIPYEIKSCVFQIADVYREEQNTHLANTVSTPDGGTRTYLASTKLDNILTRIASYRMENLFL